MEVSNLQLLARVKQLEDENETLKKQLFLQGLGLKMKEQQSKAPIEGHLPVALLQQFLLKLKPEQKNELLIGYEFIKLERLRKVKKRIRNMPLTKPEIFGGFSGNDSIVEKGEMMQVYRDSVEKINGVDNIVTLISGLTDQLTAEIGSSQAGAIANKLKKVKENIENIKNKQITILNSGIEEEVTWNRVTLLVTQLAFVMDEILKRSYPAMFKDDSLARHIRTIMSSLKEKLDLFYKSVFERQTKHTDIAPDELQVQSFPFNSSSPENRINQPDNVSSRVQQKHSPKKKCIYCKAEFSVCRNNYSMHVKSCRLQFNK